MTPFASVAMLEKFALLNIARCSAGDDVELLLRKRVQQDGRATGTIYADIQMIPVSEAGMAATHAGSWLLSAVRPGASVRCRT